MQKLMTAVFAIAFATAANAATIWWQNGLGAYGDADNEYSGTIYLMSGGADAAAAFVSAIVGAGEDGYVAAYNSAVASSLHSMDYGTDYDADITAKVESGTVYDLFVVALDSGNKGIFVSEIVSEKVLAVGDTDINFNADGSYESPFAAGVTTYDSSLGGWYTAGSVPEPTSGMLVLLGVAGLALRRRRA